MAILDGNQCRVTIHTLPSAVAAQLRRNSWHVHVSSCTCCKQKLSKSSSSSRNPVAFEGTKVKIGGFKRLHKRASSTICGKVPCFETDTQGVHVVDLQTCKGETSVWSKSYFGLCQQLISEMIVCLLLIAKTVCPPFK